LGDSLFILSRHSVGLLLHVVFFIIIYFRREPTDPFENELCEVTSGQDLDGDGIRYIESFGVWSSWRDDLADEMLNKWRSASQ
jgi:hypothetical protein